MSSVSKVHRSLWNESNISIVIDKEEEIERKIKKNRINHANETLELKIEDRLY